MSKELLGGQKKTGEPARSAARPKRLESRDVRRLKALGAFGDLELNCLAFVERLVPVRHNRGEMHKYVLTGLALNEAKSLAGVEPLYCTLFFHVISYSMF